MSDFTLGGIFSICCLASPAGTVRDVFFQLAFAGYVGAFFNLNPFIDRDGYHILVDVLREPGLRKRAQGRSSARRLTGQGPRPTDSPVLARYSIAGASVWSILAAGVRDLHLAALRADHGRASRPSCVVWTVLGTMWLALFIPVFVVLGKPLSSAAASRGPRPEV